MEGNYELGRPEGLKAATSASFGFNELNEDMEELDKGVFLLLGPHNARHTRNGYGSILYPPELSRAKVFTVCGMKHVHYYT